ncbi:methyltransferase [Catellatospora tritici]|uniref:methyltransferase n=1 Tax=Catellatospora tritici TaxID=2851566 RepID=UPI001C2D3D6C|nr:methyltransferase [Catellatospora tritici]MBV1849547.1 methyltransferase [Catellatospora tritici]
MKVDLGMAQLNQLAFGYWQSQALFAAVTVGVFDALADGPLPAAEVGSRCGVPADPALRLLDACVAIRLLTRSPDGEYANTPHTQRLLTTASPESVVRWTRVMARWYEPWGDITQALRDGKPVEDRALRLGEDPVYLADFILGMHQYNVRSADLLAHAVDQQGARTLVDVGGGAGTYSIAFCRAWQDLRCEVVDLGAVVPLARETVEAAGLTDRIRVRTGDYYSDAFGAADVDVVLLSNVLHQESPQVCVDILRRARAALAEGGRVLVHGHFLDEARTSPAFTTLHNLSALVLWDGGRSYTVAEMTALMQEAGLGSIQELPAPEGSAKLLVGQASA